MNNNDVDVTKVTEKTAIKFGLTWSQSAADKAAMTDLELKEACILLMIKYNCNLTQEILLEAVINKYKEVLLAMN